MKAKRLFIVVKGIVQGVGFRPFVYNLAKKQNLKGWVNNNSEGVYIDIEGPKSTLDSFLFELKNSAPPLSMIEEISCYERDLENYSNFTIKESQHSSDTITLVSPDIALCNDCRDDILNINNRRFRYPFTNCTNCGPRFSIIKALPYDRDKTTMVKFPMCSECGEEYTDPANRRFHAQPNACRDCGPSIWLEDNSGNKLLHEHDTIKWTIAKLKEGKIFAVKGIGGFHLVCDACNFETVKMLRLRKGRPHKPFAVMMKDIETVKRYCNVDLHEEKLLTGIRKPIVLLDRQASYELPENIAPNQSTLGVMLPFTPLHELLFQEDVEVLIMTSANSYSLPLEYSNCSARKNLTNIVDYFLMHNRDIHAPIDDSVARIIDSTENLVRRARGYAPEPVRFKCDFEILACGPNMKNTFAISKESFIFLSQHNGDLENMENMERYENNINHFKRLFRFEPQYVACDLHPEYYSTSYAENLSLPIVPVQHHHAHAVSCMIENSLPNKEVIAVVFDGTGYGTDENIWGGEFLICNFHSFYRVGHLDYIKMPGGESAIKEPWKMGCSYLHNASINSSSFSFDIRKLSEDLFGPESTTVVKMLEKNINCVNTSSMGRLIDSVSAILGVCTKASYEGQASIELEGHTLPEVSEHYTYNYSSSLGFDGSSCYFEDDTILDKLDYFKGFTINTAEIINEILLDMQNKVSINIISTKFHNTIANMVLNSCIRIRNYTGIDEVVLSGGVFQNRFLLKQSKKLLIANKFAVHVHSSFPSNDGGVALGQIVIANERLKKCQKI